MPRRRRECDLEHTAPLFDTTPSPRGANRLGYPLPAEPRLGVRSEIAYFVGDTGRPDGGRASGTRRHVLVALANPKQHSSLGSLSPYKHIPSLSKRVGYRPGDEVAPKGLPFGHGSEYLVRPQRKQRRPVWWPRISRVSNRVPSNFRDPRACVSAFPVSLRVCRRLRVCSSDELHRILASELPYGIRPLPPVVWWRIVISIS